MKKLVLINLAFWLAAIAFPFLARSLPTASGSPPKIYDVLIPMIQFMLAFGSTYIVSLALKTKGASAV